MTAYVGKPPACIVEMGISSVTCPGNIPVLGLRRLYVDQYGVPFFVCLTRPELFPLRPGRFSTRQPIGRRG